MMRAATFQTVGQPLLIESLAEPEPGDGEVILRVSRCGICGTDLHMTAGEGRSLPKGQVIGHEVSGEVVALGRKVEGVKLGDRVASLPIRGCGTCPACKAGEPAWCSAGFNFLTGGYAQFARASDRGCLILPRSLSFADGALIEPLAVALHGVNSAGPAIRGASVLVLGAGPIGLGVIYWARRLGAARIDVVENNPVRAEMAMAMGATAATTSDDQSPPGVAPSPGIVFECVGKPGLLATAIGRVGPRGTVVSLGACLLPETITAFSALLKEVTLKFPVVYSLADFQATIDAFDSGAVEPRMMITDTVKLDALPTRFEQLRTPGTDCKVMVDPWG